MRERRKNMGTLLAGESVCFEPGIFKREGEKGRLNIEVSGTIRAEMGDNQPAVMIRTQEERKKD